MFKLNNHTFRIIMPSLVALLLVLSHTTRMVSAVCNNMQVFKGKEEVTDTVCIREYMTNDCLAFSETYNVSYLPEDGMRSYSVQRPGSLDVMPTSKPYEGDKMVDHYPSVQFSWKSPTTGTARRSIKGFYLWLQSDDQAQTECRIFSINHSLYISDELMFHYDIDKISNETGRNYTAKMYSLPLPNNSGPQLDKWMRNFENYKWGIIKTVHPFKTEKKKDQLAKDWKPGIAIEQNYEEQTIDVRFSLPDPNLQYNFTNFTVGLVNVDQNPFNFIADSGLKNIYIPLSTKETSGYVQFTKLDRNTWYRVVVKVRDSFRYIQGKCLCYKIESVFGTVNRISCVNSCSSSSTAIFDLQGSVALHPWATHAPPTVTDDNSSSDPPTVLPSTPSSTKTSADPVITPVKGGGGGGGGDDIDNTTIIAIVVPATVCLVLIISLIVFIFRKCQNDKYDTQPQIPVPVPPTTPRYPLSRKTVYLLSSSDHEYHQVMAKKFVEFLQTHCHCNVIEPSEWEASQHQGGSASWLADKLHRCDLILFLDSLGAFNRLEAFNQNNMYRPLEIGPKGDLFNLGLEYVYNTLIENNQNDKAILVSWTEERSKARLLKFKEYVLPRYLSPFLQQLHAFGSDKVSRYKNQLPMVAENLPNLPGGSDLLQSVKDVQTFEKANPGWFSACFELIENKTTTNPELERLTSIQSGTDSDYFSMRSDQPRSVTPSPGNSTNSSPVSDYSDHLPDFPTTSPFSLDGRCGDNDDDNSCFTLQTGPPLSYVLPAHQQLEGQDHNPDDIDILHEQSRRNGSKFSSNNVAARKKIVPPPTNNSEFNAENFSVAMAGLNHDSYNKTNNHDIHAQRGLKVIIPPTTKSDIVADDFSTALCDLNLTNQTQRKPVGVNGGDGSAVDGSGSHKPSNASRGVNKVSNQEVVLIPPTNGGDDQTSQCFSQYLDEINSDFKNKSKNSSLPSSSPLSKTSSSLSPSKAAVAAEANTRNPRKTNSPGNAQIRLPEDSVPTEEVDNFSQCLANDINSDFTKSKRKSHPSSFCRNSKDDKNKINNSGNNFNKKKNILPPPSDAMLAADADNFSCALVDMNARSEGVFAPSTNSDAIEAGLRSSKGDEKKEGNAFDHSQNTTFQDTISIHL